VQQHERLRPFGGPHGQPRFEHELLDRARIETDLEGAVGASRVLLHVTCRLGGGGRDVGARSGIARARNTHGDHAQRLAERRDAVGLGGAAQGHDGLVERIRLRGADGVGGPERSRTQRQHQQSAGSSLLGHCSRELRPWAAV
jgi:hypothetical protein